MIAEEYIPRPTKGFLRRKFLLGLGALFFVQFLTFCQNTIPQNEESISSSLNQISSLYFDSKETEKAVLRLIEDARESISISLYGLENEAVTDALISAYYQRGIKVRLSSELDSAISPSWQKLVRYNLPVRFGNRGGIMHNKYIIVDRKYILTGSTNLSKNLHKNYNHSIVLRSPALAREYLKDFELQLAGYYGTKKDEGYDRIIGGLEKESHELYWNLERHDFGASRVRAFFTPYKDTFLEYSRKPQKIGDTTLAPCMETCLGSFSGDRGLCPLQDCKERACYRASSTGHGKIIYAYPNYDMDGKLYCDAYKNAMNSVLSFVRKARHSILILAFSFRDRLLMDELIRAKEEKGVSVKIWIDHSQFRSGYRLSKDSFHTLARRIDFLKTCRPGEGLLHHKAIVIDERDILLGSLNFSRNAVNSNDENFLVITNAPALAKDFCKEALRLDRYCSAL